jgi:hypothetical protein
MASLCYAHMLPPMTDPPRPRKRLSQAEQDRVALALLREMAAEDPAIAEILREHGIPLIDVPRERATFSESED